MNPRCRIGSVRLKGSPHLAEIKPRIRGREFEAEMKAHLDTICGHYRDEGIAGLVVVGWGFDGSFNRAYRIHPASFVGQTLLPSFVADILRRDTAADAARDVLNGDL